MFPHYHSPLAARAIRMVFFFSLVFVFSALLWAGLRNRPASTAQAAAFATTYFVRTDGSNACNGMFNASAASTPNCAFQTIQFAINTAVATDTINVAAGTYAENVTLNKSLTLNGAQAGVNACGRVATESIISAAAGTLLTLQAGSAGAIINGFTLSGGVRGLESTGGPINNVQILNNRVIGFTGSGIFLNDNGIDITVNQNSIDGASKTGTGDLFHLDTDSFAGLQFTNNCINGKGATDTSSGFFVDGNHNVGVSVTPKTPLISGNTITNCQTGANLGTRAFTGGTISGNTFGNSLFDGLQGGIQLTLISNNVFSNNGRHGLALTSFGNTGADRGGQNTMVKGNLMTGNGFNASPNNGAGLFFSATQAAGTISTNHANLNRIVGNAVGASYSGTEVIDAENNWWGCNFGPGTGGAGCVGTVNALSGTSPPSPSASTIDANPWLRLGITAVPNTIALGGTSNLTADLTFNSASVDTSGAGNIPNGTPAAFAGTGGTVMPPSTTTTAGKAMSVFTGTVVGAGSASTTVDGQTVSTGIAVTCLPISLSGLPNGTAGVPYSQMLTASPPGSYSFSFTGTLPPGLMLASNGLLSGTPATVGSFTFTVTATLISSPGCTGSRTYTVVIGCPTISLTPVTLPNAEVGTAYNQTITATPAGGNYSFAVTNGFLPPGLTLNAAGQLAGTPAQTGTFNFRVTATGFGGCSGFRDYQIVVTGCAPITVNPATLPGGTVGTAYNQTVSATPAGAYSFTVSSGALPTGLTLNTATGVISGTPATAGSFSFRVSATLDGCSGFRDYTVAIGCSTITISPGSLPAGTAGAAYSQTLSVSPAGSYTFSLAQGNLPSGLTLNPNTGVISGLPSVTGTVSFIVKVQTAGGCSATQAYSLSINCPPAVTLSPASLPSGATGTAYSQTISASPAGGNYTFAVTSGSLPAGLNLNPATGVLSGTPTTNGVFNFTVTATGFGGCTGSQTYSITIGNGGCPAITLPASLPNGSVGALYSQAVAASPAALYSYAVTAGSLPPGVALYDRVGLLFGFPTTPGSYNFSITATDNNSCTATQMYAVTIGGMAALAQFGDYDGDGKSDPVLWSAGNGAWSMLTNGSPRQQTVSWGMAGDMTLLGDYDGDGRSDPAVYRPSDGTWYVKQSSDGGVLIKHWGVATDVPVPGDYDGDGKTDIAVWRPSEGNWYILQSSDQQYRVIAWGAGYAPYDDVPVPADYDGDRLTDLAIFRRSNGYWFVRLSGGGLIASQWGQGTDVPVPADYDGDGKADLAVWNGLTSTWYITESRTGAIRTEVWGASYAPYYDRAAPCDYDGDGKADIAVWRASDATWYLKLSSASGGVQSLAHGQTADLPVASRAR